MKTFIATAYRPKEWQLHYVDFATNKRIRFHVEDLQSSFVKQLQKCAKNVKDQDKITITGTIYKETEHYITIDDSQIDRIEDLTNG